MRNISKSFSLLLILALALSSLIIPKSAFAQTPTPSSGSTQTPSVATFTLQLVGPSYTMPTTYSLNQSSGQIVAQIGYTNEYSNIVVTVENQAYANFYNIQIKDHDQTDDWADLYTTADGGNYPMQSPDSNYTSISISIEEEGLAGRQIDIQVQAMDGNVVNTVNPYSPNSALNPQYAFEGETSGWSKTETVIVPANTPLSSTPTLTSSTSTLTPTSTLTSVSSASYASLLLIALVVIAFLLAVIIFLLLYMRRRKASCLSKGKAT